MKRELQIDYLKGLAIISVILLHSLTINQRDIIGGTYYILQAIPVFLILAGYNTIRSYLNKGITDLNSCYEKSYLMKKFKRIVLPYIFIWILELLILVITKQPVAITAKNLLILFIIGGWGPGGYFVALMVQFIIIIPVLYKIAQYNRYVMLITSFIISMSFEIISHYSNISNNYYRIASFRFLFAVALGVYLALYQIKKRRLLIVGVLFSLVYITSINYFGLTLPVYNIWQSQNAPSFLWAFALVIIGLKKLPSKSKTIMGQLLGEIGRRSYHIFLCQALYFMSLVGLTSNLKVYIATPINVIVSIVLGLVFYQIETKFYKHIHFFGRGKEKKVVAQ